MESFPNRVSPLHCAANVMVILENSEIQIKERQQIERLYREITSGKFSSTIYENMENGEEKRDYLTLLQESTRLEKDEEFCLEFLRELESLIIEKIRNTLERIFKP